MKYRGEIEPPPATIQKDLAALWGVTGLGELPTLHVYEGGPSRCNVGRDWVAVRSDKPREHLIVVVAHFVAVARETLEYSQVKAIEAELRKAVGW